ncbi:MAG: hypothetical protein ACK5NM_14200, partial [Cyclobacteriaceae bacterium]
AKSPAKKKSIRRFKNVFGIVFIGIMLFLSFFQKADTGSEKISGIILSVLTIGILLITFKIQKFLKSEFDFDFNFERKVAFYEPIVTIVLLVVHSNLFAIVKHEMIDQNVPKVLAEKGKRLKEGYNELAAKYQLTAVTTCQGFDCRTIITFNASAGDPLILKSFVQQEMIKRGVLWGGFHNVCFTHSEEDINYTLKVYDTVLSLLAEALKGNDIASLLLGKPVEAVFRKVGDVQKAFKEKALH